MEKNFAERLEPRKIIQICVTPLAFLGFTFAYRQHALCDDGTLWYRDAVNKKDSAWKLVDDEIPVRR